MQSAKQDFNKHTKSKQSVHCGCLDNYYTKFMSVFISEVTLSYTNTDTPTENEYI